MASTLLGAPCGVPRPWWASRPTLPPLSVAHLPSAVAGAALLNTSWGLGCTIHARLPPLFMRGAVSIAYYAPEAAWTA